MIELAWPVRVYYEDTDAGGMVYHANYLKYLERARTEMLRQTGFEHDRLLQDENIIFIVYRICVDYLKPAFMNDLLTVMTTIYKTGNASIHFNQTIQNQSEDLICKADVKVACIDQASMKPVPIPESIIVELHNDN